MGPGLLLLFLGFYSQHVSADIASEINQDDAFFEAFQDNLYRLSSIQQKILDISPADEFLDYVPTNRPIIMNLIASRPERPPMNPEQSPNLFEGDMILTKEQMQEILSNAEHELEKKRNNESSNETRAKRTVISNLKRRWTFPIPYFIKNDSKINEKAVLRGIEEWEKQTCATFKRVEETYKGNSIEFIRGSGCYSFVGKVNNRPQQISIGNGCTSLGTVTHEIGHSLGFYHEQARWDRDDYVEILTKNIQAKYAGQFSKQGEKGMVDFGVGYDYGSVMHYDQSSFKKGSTITIETREGDYQHTIGQRSMPSFSDIKRINFAYCNSTCAVELNCRNGGYTDPKNCSICRCPDGLEGKLCTEIQKSPESCGHVNLTAGLDLKTVSAKGKMDCFFLITAPNTHAVYYEVSNFSFTNHIPCLNDYLEIKYHKNWVKSGARLCKETPKNSMSETNNLLLIYRGGAKSEFTLKYRMGILIVPLPPTTEVITTPSTSTIMITTTTTTPTTTPTTTSSIRSTTTTETTTTSTLPSTTTIGSTHSPTTTEGSSTLTSTTTQTTPDVTSTIATTATAMNTIETRPNVTTPSIGTTLTTLSTILQTETTEPVSTDFTEETYFPPEQTEPPGFRANSACTPWTACSSQCGACGMTSRRCGLNHETKACNLLICEDSSCCPPARNVRGLCIVHTKSVKSNYINVDDLLPPVDYPEDF